MPQQPYALLVTDVIDSTKLAETLGDARVAQVWASHDRLARDLLATHKGREIDKSDGFLLLFESVSNAVEYALAYHKALESLELSARAGLHVGEVRLRENSAADVARGAKPLEVEGIAKPTAARVMSVAQAGQTLLTEAAGTALGETAVRVESHGHWRMKGIAEPIELFEAGAASAPFSPPPDSAKVYRVVRQGEQWLPVKQVDHSLPAERDAFVGRREDLDELARRLDEGARLVSVLGIGGTGKTRLVTHFCWTWLGDWPGGVWFCDLSEARSADGIAHAVARALGVPLRADPIPQLGHAIAGRGRCLVVLDNFEQVARHAKETLGRWLDRAVDAQFVVTTREVLGLRGETALALAPMEDAEGVALFVARAQQAMRDFVLDVECEPSVHQLVRLLDGLPLAIELAAARARMMTPKTLLERMSQRFRLLTSSGGRRDRQATLRGALDWSWDLLSTDEKTALAQVSVFEGGFTLEAAAAVLDLGELWPEDAVSALLDKSLLRRVSDERFDLLVSVQEYAAERLDAAGRRTQAEVRHGAYFASLGSAEAIAALGLHGGVERRWALATELGNLVVATRRAVARADGPVATATLDAAWEVLRLRGPAIVGVELATAVRGVATLAALSRAGVLQVLGHALAMVGRGAESRAHLDEALRTAREVGARREEGGVLGNLGVLLWSQGRLEEAGTHLDEALTVAREVGDRRDEGTVLSNLGNLCADHGRAEEAETHLAQALAIAREVGDRASEALVLANLGALDHTHGRTDKARVHYEQALAVAREIGSRGSEGLVLGNLGALHRSQGRLDESQVLNDQALAVAREIGNRSSEAYVLGNLGALYERQGGLDEARAHFEEAQAIAHEVGDRHLEGGLFGVLGALDTDGGRLTEARALLEAGESLLREIGDPLQLGVLLCRRARLELAESREAAAEATLVEVEALVKQTGAGAESELAEELVKARAALARA